MHTFLNSIYIYIYIYEVQLKCSSGVENTCFIVFGALLPPVSQCLDSNDKKLINSR